jgi:uncharacterized zinc-type alcohol dehydrogenase-like protein
MHRTPAYAAMTAGAPLAPFSIERRAPDAHDVLIDILYCGVCHSDIHQVRDEWGGSIFPMVPGHEIVGRVAQVGAHVTRFKVGDAVGVGCFVDSCRECGPCHAGEEQYCDQGMTGTYNSLERETKQPTYGGYSTRITVNENYVLRIPESLPLDRAAPLLCAGITTWSPLRKWNVGPGSRVGVIGLGGLGHMAVKLAAGLGAEVTVLSRTADKAADAKALGADRLLVSSDPAAMKAAASSFDLIIDTVPVKHDLTPYLPLLDVDGTLVIVGQIGGLPESTTVPYVMGRRRVAGSPIGGIRETQELLDFCARKNILPDVEMIRMDEINEAWERMARSDVRYRFVIDMSSLPAAAG